MAQFIVAIDGGAGAGKSTTAKGVAERLGFFYIDTGAMYRVATLKYIWLGGASQPIDMALVDQTIQTTSIKLEKKGDDLLVYLDDHNVTHEIRTPRVNDLVSPISALPAIREWMVRQQRAVAKGRNCVCEGRDIGTVVFPDAQVKIFMKADLKERAKRRAQELAGRSAEVTLNEVIENLQYRDNYDSNRTHSPLKKAEDAIVVDTTHLTIQEEISLVEGIVRERYEKIEN
jgi:cytidylate kinase